LIKGIVALKKHFIFLLLTIMTSLSAVAQQQILAVTEHSALQYMDGDRISGKGTEAVRAVLNKAKLDYKIKIYPWARAYSIASNQENVLIFSMVRTPQREQHFKWVGELLESDYQFYRLKRRDDIVINSIEDTRNYSIGAVRSSIIHQTLASRNYHSLNLVANIDINLKKLQMGRLDLMIHQPGYFEKLCARNGIDHNLFEPILSFNYVNQGLYMAYSNLTDDAIVNQTRTAFDELKTAGVIDKIMSLEQ